MWSTISEGEDEGGDCRGTAKPHPGGVDLDEGILTTATESTWRVTVCQQ